MIIEFNKPLKEYFNGFMITEDYNIITNYNGEEETHNGCYFLVKKINDTLEITQDFFGCYGAYIYTENEYFVISDCLMELSIFLKGKLTLNHKYYNRLINAREVAFSLTETVFNEIKRYNGSYKIIIDNKLKIETIDYKINSINFGDSNYLKILDKWYFKWINIFKNLKGDIIQDLSGGIDTRILLSMAINSDSISRSLFRNKEQIFNKELDEDNKIGSEIIAKYNLPKIKKVFINKNQTNNNYNYIIGNSNFTASIKSQPIKKLFRICGNGGLLYLRPNTFKNLLYFRYSSVDKNLEQDYNNYYNSIKIPEYIKEQNLKKLYIYRKLIVELRDGIKSADYFRTNTIMLCPMMDPELNVLNPLNEKGQSILPYIILNRYCSELLNFKIEGTNEKNLCKITNMTILNNKCINNTRRKDNKIFFFRFEKEKLNNDGSHSTGTNFHLIDNLVNSTLNN